MKTNKPLIILSMLIPLLAYGEETDLCLENAKTQSEMNISKNHLVS